MINAKLEKAASHYVVKPTAVNSTTKYGVRLTSQGSEGLAEFS